MRKLPLIPLREVVLFPNSIYPLVLGREFSKNALEEALKIKEKELIFLAQKDPSVNDPEIKDLYTVGTLGRVLTEFKSPEGNYRIVVEGIERVKILNIIFNGKFYEAEFEIYERNLIENERAYQLARIITENFRTLTGFLPGFPEDLLAHLFSKRKPIEIADFVSTHLPVKAEVKQELLEIDNLLKYLEELNKKIIEEIEFRKLKIEIEEKTREELQKSQKQVFLHEQMKQIQKELGYREGDEIQILKEKIEKSGMPEDVKEHALKELRKLEITPSISPEAAVIRTYLDWLISMPWNKRTKDTLDLKKAKKILDEDHYGLFEPKNRILEYLSILKLKGKITGQILCFVGPPGSGKTSLAKSIAKALGRKFVRMSLGGIRDEAEIRGHRRTYVGALPGRIIQGIKKAGSKNPVFLLDEIDKVGMDYRGDPYAALMEVLDPDVNKHFVDHYLEVEFDLSEVLFITTANSLYKIPLALRDRMEIINLPGYSEFEKLMIAKKHLIKRILEEVNLNPKYFSIEDSAILEIIRKYTREAGVRELERKLSKVIRYAAKNFVEKGEATSVDKKDLSKILGPAIYTTIESERKLKPGVAYGLAWTEYGGDIMRIEVLLMEGKGELTLTGQLGDVLKESVYASVSYLRSMSKIYNLPKDFHKKYDIHLHIPEGAIPKDGPSAGLAIVLAILSALIKKELPSDTAFTGEITLTGEVLRIGGLEEKINAAKRGGIKRILLPEDSKPDVKKARRELKEGIDFCYIKTINEAINIVFPDLIKNKIKSGEFSHIVSFKS
ncbi:MAG: endopeptidase La [candidate division WOR-3 bacterium]